MGGSLRCSLLSVYSENMYSFKFLFFQSPSHEPRDHLPSHRQNKFKAVLCVTSVFHGMCWHLEAITESICRALKCQHVQFTGKHFSQKKLPGAREMAQLVNGNPSLISHTYKTRTSKQTKLQRPNRPGLLTCTWNPNTGEPETGDS